MSGKHNDCINFECFDVLKGLCLASNALVPYDGTSCPKFEAKPKCKSCGAFSNQNEDGIGTCLGMGKSYWALSERIATNCGGYKQR